MSRATPNVTHYAELNRDTVLAERLRGSTQLEYLVKTHSRINATKQFDARAQQLDVDLTENRPIDDVVESYQLTI